VATNDPVSRGSTVTEIADWLGGPGPRDDTWRPDDLPETFWVQVNAVCSGLVQTHHPGRRPEGQREPAVEYLGRAGCRTRAGAGARRWERPGWSSSDRPGDAWPPRLADRFVARPAVVVLVQTRAAGRGAQRTRPCADTDTSARA